MQGKDLNLSLRMNVHEAEWNRTLTQCLKREPGLRQAIVFGSLARGEARADSDVDVAVRLNRPLNVEDRRRLMGEIALATGRPVDLVDLWNVGEPLLGRILHHGIQLIGSEADMAGLLYRHVVEQEDFMPARQRILEARRKMWIGR